MNQRKWGILQVLGSGLLFGLLGPLGKSAFALGLAPFELLSLRFLFGGILLNLICSLRYKNFLLPDLPMFFKLMALGISGYALFSSLYFFAIKEIPASLAVLLLYTYPVMVTVFATFLGQENLTARKFGCLIVASLGMALLLGADFSQLSLSGVIYGLGSAFFYSLYILASEKWLRKLDPFWATSWIQMGAGVALFVLAFQDFQRPLEIIKLAWPILMAITLFCSIGAMSLFQAGLQKLTPMETSLLSLSEPISGIILSMVLVGERLNLLQMLGGFMIISSLAVLSFATQKKITD